MSLRTSFQKLIRRDATALSLRERAAELRASIRPRPVEPQAHPTPGSPEAMAAWHAACHEHSVRTAPLQDCPDLMRSDREVWGTKSLMRAMETGEITVAEYARLQPLAGERELRFAEITHELRIGELFALAYAGEYPVSSDENAPAAVEPDPIFAAIAAGRRAEAGMEAVEAAFGGRRLTDAEQTQEDAAEREQRDTRASVWAIVPTTVEGRAALAEYVVFQMKLTFGPNWRAKVEQEFCGDALLALLAAIDPANQAQA